MNLLFSINRKFIPLWEQCMATILRHGGAAHYDLYVLHSDPDGGGRGPGCRRPCAPRTAAPWSGCRRGLFEGFPETGRYPVQIYYRLAAPLLLPEALNRILYLDVDTVVLNSLEPLYTSDFAGGGLYGVQPHPQVPGTSSTRPVLGLEDGVRYLNSGVLMMDLALLRRTLRLEDIRDYAERYKKQADPAPIRTSSPACSATRPWCWTAGSTT